MRLKKVFYCIFSIIMLSTIVLTNIILIPTDKITKTKVKINYNNRFTNEDMQMPYKLQLTKYIID